MKGKKTVILVTHQISYLYGCEKVIIMENGSVLAYDSPENMKTKLN